jgi:hypothetical protein
VVIGAIIGVVVLAGILWAALGMHGSTPPVTTSTVLSTQTYNSSQLSVDSFLSTLAAYNQQLTFTANYTGTIYTPLSTSPQPMTGNLMSQFQRYNDSAVSITSISSPEAGNLQTAVYYTSNGLSYACSKSTLNYSCQQIPTAYNATTFGLSVFLGALSNSSAKTASHFNSSYDGIPCIAISTSTNSTYNDSGVIVKTSSIASGCVQPVYRIPLVLNLSSESSAAGSYLNGTKETTITPVSEQVMVNLHLVGLTNSSSQSAVTTLPANAVIVR